MNRFSFRSMLISALVSIALLQACTKAVTSPDPVTVKPTNTELLTKPTWTVNSFTVNGASTAISNGKLNYNFTTTNNYVQATVLTDSTVAIMYLPSKHVNQGVTSYSIDKYINRNQKYFLFVWSFQNQEKSLSIGSTPDDTTIWTIDELSTTSLKLSVTLGDGTKVATTCTAQ